MSIETLYIKRVVGDVFGFRMTRLDIMDEIHR